MSEIELPRKAAEILVDLEAADVDISGFDERAKALHAGVVAAQRKRFGDVSEKELEALRPGCEDSVAAAMVYESGLPIATDEIVKVEDED